MAPLKWIGFFAILAIAEASKLVDNKQEKRGLNTIGNNLHAPNESVNSEHYKSSTHENPESNYASNQDSKSKSSNVITKTVKVPVPQPYPVTVDKPIPVPVHVPVDRPYTVEVPQPYTITKDTPVPVYVNRPVPYTVRVPIKVPVLHRVEVSVPKPYPVPIDRPYPVNIPKPVVIERQVPVIINQGQNEYGGGYAASGGHIGSFNNQEFSSASSPSSHDLASGQLSYSQNNDWAPLLSNNQGAYNNGHLSNTLQTQSHGSLNDLSSNSHFGGHLTQNSNPSLSLPTINIGSGNEYSQNSYQSIILNNNGHSIPQSYSSGGIYNDNHVSTLTSDIAASGYSSSNSGNGYLQYQSNNPNINGHSIPQSFSTESFSNNYISDPSLSAHHTISNDIPTSEYTSLNSFSSNNQNIYGHPSLESYSSQGVSTDYHNSISSINSQNILSNDISSTDYSSQNSHPINTLTFRDRLTVHPPSQLDSTSNDHSSYNSFPSQELSVGGHITHGSGSGLFNNGLPQNSFSSNDFPNHNSYISNNLHVDEHLPLGSYSPQSLSPSGYSSNEINLSSGKLTGPGNVYSSNNYAKNYAYHSTQSSPDSQNSVQSYPSQSLSVGYSIEDSHPSLGSATAEYSIHDTAKSHGHSNGESVLSSSSPSHSSSIEGFHSNRLTSGFHSSHGTSPDTSKSGGAISYQHVTIYH